VVLISSGSDAYPTLYLVLSTLRAGHEFYGTGRKPLKAAAKL
jgi:hypothetical protein